MSASVNFNYAKLTDLTGHVALVTGGGSGVGLMITKALASSGAKVYITGRRLEVLREAEKLKFAGTGKIVALQMDVTDKESIQSGVDVVRKAEGKLHILVNNAGSSGTTVPFMLDPNAPEHKSTAIYGKALFDSQNFKEWEATYAINAAALFFVTTAFLELLDAGARDPATPGATASVINITSTAGQFNVSLFYSMYIPSKSAAAHVSRLLAADFALKDIPVRVNALAPGVFPSDMTGTQEQVDAMAKTPLFAQHRIPAGRAGRATDVGALALYLASAASDYTNGQEIVMDGGWSIVNP